MRNILLINPPVYDFAAYDLWAKPLGLLYLSSILKQQNIDVQFFDYMDRNYPNIEVKKSNKYGCGHYIQEIIDTPQIISNIKRRYKRFGIPQNIAIKYFSVIKKPDMIIIGSLMTYWYLGITEVASLLKQIFPDVPIILGGIYATLCHNHAKTIKGIDEVVSGTFNNFNIIFKKYDINAMINSTFDNFPMPDYSFYRKLEYISLKISTGCPYNCDYCAQHILNGNTYSFKSPHKITNEIIELTNVHKLNNIAFYDDALLYKANNNIKIILKELIKNNKHFYFHTPNGLHARFLDQELTDLMYNAKFIQPRFSLETSNPYEQTFSDNKTNNKQFERCIGFLTNAGYKQNEYTTYLLIGLPNQNIDFIKDSIKFVHNLGSKISLSEYSPILHTKIGGFIDNKYKQDPLYQNNTYFISQSNDYNKLIELKKLAKELNKKL